MGIENFRSSKLFFENYKKVEIKITSSINNDGRLKTDQLGNVINSSVPVGRNYIRECTSFTIDGSEKLLLHTSDDKQYSLIDGTYSLDTDSISNIINTMQFRKGVPLFYKIRANDETVKFSGNTATFSNINGKTLYRVEVNGELIDPSNYTQSTNFIIFNSDDVRQFNNYASVVYYDSNQTLSSTNITFKYLTPYKNYFSNTDEIKNGIELTGTVVTTTGNILRVSGTSIQSELLYREYIRTSTDVYKILNWKTNGANTDIYVDGKWSSTHVGEGVYLMNSYFMSTAKDFNVNPSYEYNISETRGSKLPRKRKTRQSNVLTFNSYNNNTEDPDCNFCPLIKNEFLRYINSNNKFRIVQAFELLDGTEKIVYYTNARILDGVSYSRNSDQDKNNYSIEFEDKITIVPSGVGYGEGYYGAGGYGSAESVIQE